MDKQYRPVLFDLDEISIQAAEIDDTPLIIKFRMFAIWASVVMLGFTVVCFVYATTTDLYSDYAVTDILLGILSLELARVMLAVTYRASQLWGELSNE
jgi:hypothetical protein